MGKKTVRVLLDAVLTVMIVFEMFIQYTGNFLHEVVGFAFFACVAVHLALSAKWMKGAARATKAGRLSGRNAALAVVGCLLAVDMAVLGISSVAISQIVSSTGFVWTLGSYAAWATVHSVSSYALCAIVVVHLAMHWAFLAHALRVPYDPSRRRAIGTGVHAVAALGAVTLGVMAVREAMPQTVAQAVVGDTADAGAAEKGDVFGNVSDIAQDSSADAADGTSSSSAGSASSSSTGSASSTDSTTGKKHFKKHGKGAKSTQDSSQSVPDSGSTSDSSSQGQSDGDSWAPVPEEQYAEEDAYVSEPDDSSSVSGFCTLCRKQCPLSAPQCDRPYEAGLL